MKTSRFSSLTLFLAGTTVALLGVFGLQALSGSGQIHDSVAQVGQELLPEAFAGFGVNQLPPDTVFSNYLS